MLLCSVLLAGVEAVVDHKKVTRSSYLGQQGVALIERIVQSMGFVWRPTVVFDAGIDGTIEIRDPETGDVTNCLIQVQSKATRSSFQADDGRRFRYTCDGRDLDYWLNGNTPVILVLTRPDSDEAYWMSIKHYFADLDRRKTRTIVFDRNENRFDTKCRDSLLQLAAPVASGLYLAPTPKSERLSSNLLPVSSYPDELYTACTDCATRSEVWSELNRQCDDPGAAWVLRGKQVMSFYDLGGFSWPKICDRGTVERHRTAEWALSDDPATQRDFVELLNLALKDTLESKGVHFDRRERCFFFPATEDLRRNSVRYLSTQKQTERAVFHPVTKRSDPTQVAFYRHCAFEGQFVRHGDVWYLQICPTYRFTFDGYHTCRKAADLLSNMRRMEKNAAVLGQVTMWARILGETSLFVDAGQLLTFGSLQTFELDWGIDDPSWLKHEEDLSRVAGGEASEGQLVLL